MRRKIVVLTVAVALCGVVVPQGIVSSAAVVEDEQWPNPALAIEGHHTFLIEESPMSNGAQSSHSVLMANGTSGAGKLCTGPSDPNCNTPAGLYFRAVLPPCSTTITIDCVESLSAEKGGVVSPATLDGLFPAATSNTFAGDAARKIPTGATPSLWSIDGAPHSFGNKYLVMVSVAGGEGTNQSPEHSLTAQIFAASVFQTDCDPRFNGTCQDKYSESVDPTTGKQKIDFSGVAADFGKYRCVAWGDDAKCALRHAFPAETSFSLKVRLSKSPRGWLHGRMADPVIDFQTEGATTVVLVKAEPVKVPTISAAQQWNALPVNLQTWFNNQCPSACGTRMGDTRFLEGSRRNASYQAQSNSQDGFDSLELWKPFLKDTASAIPSVWSMRTLLDSEMGDASSCIANKTGVTGIVTTNATLYAQGPPRMNQLTKNLDYKVATTHFQPEGKTEFLGTYDLLVREDIANCLYGLKRELAANTTAYVEESPYTAEDAYAGDTDFEEEERLAEDILFEEATAEALDATLGDEEVTDEDVFANDEFVATVDAEVSSETSSPETIARAGESISMIGGWFKFSANNFTFSAPTVKVRIGVKPAKSQLCIQGVSLKKSVGVRPTCPSGYSKASVKVCVKGKAVRAAIAVSPKCAKGFATAKSVKCAKGSIAKQVFGVSPKCSKGYSKVVSIKCVKGMEARVLTAANPRCANGFRKALTISCKKGNSKRPITAVKPKCPSGYRKD